MRLAYAATHATETEVLQEHAGTEPGPGTPKGESARIAFLAFVALETVALPLLLVLGHFRWFSLDDWDFLAARDAGNLRDLLTPHNEHWSTVPILVYRSLWYVVGIRSYVPYQFVLVVLHLTVAALLGLIMRRSGVGPWIATAAASLFVFLGAGYEDVVWAFQIGFVGALVLGLTHLVLADHDGAMDRRDWLGLGAGIAGLMCSGVAVTMTVVVGLAVLVRRGWRMAALHTAPLAIIFVAWWAAFARDQYFSPQRGGRSPADQWFRFVLIGLAAAFERMGQVPGVGIALAVLLVAGAALTCIPLRSDVLRQRAAAPAALLVGAVVFLFVSGAGRAVYGAELARLHTRYTHIVVALALPAVAFAVNAVAHRWRVLTPALITLFLIGIPGNVNTLVSARDQQQKFQSGYRTLILSLPRVPAARKVPRWVRPEPLLAHDVTIGWLLDGVASGRVPHPGRIDARSRADLTIRLVVVQTHRRVTGECAPPTSAAERQLSTGESVRFQGGPVRVTELGATGARGAPSLLLNPAFGSTVSAFDGPLRLRFNPQNPKDRVVLCG